MTFCNLDVKIPKDVENWNSRHGIWNGIWHWETYAQEAQHTKFHRSGCHELLSDAILERELVKLKYSQANSCMKHRHKVVRHAWFIKLQSMLLHHCTVRNDAWDTEIKGRIAACNDLCAEEAWYHRNCYMRFVRDRSLLSDQSASVGRHADSKKSDAFFAACEWSENECESCLLTLDELLLKMHCTCHVNLIAWLWWLWRVSEWVVSWRHISTIGLYNAIQVGCCIEST